MLHPSVTRLHSLWVVGFYMWARFDPILAYYYQQIIKRLSKRGGNLVLFAGMLLNSETYRPGAQ